ncbi:spore germination protein GerPB [Virgibacillus sp. FSP13]|uniref:spore germination protein GerPB n=1 Tax=Lentibacillus sp. Marseille-P4043 TaxID=2040293 RepID=UPI000D0BB193|nr:spore germination protein GerPB [Lentibacillus sp. Marseille-P4043]
MNMTIHQSINIYMIKIGSITNSSVLQIGSTGSIQAQADIHNTGGYTEPAEEAIPLGKRSTPLIPLSQTKHDF